MKQAGVLALLLTLAACSGATSSTGAPPGEEQALNEAAASLDANTMNTNAAEIVDEDGGGNESQPQ
ncbi:hypothetical protein [Sphingomonas psychrolutea]|uniref:Secreted protein n=1 Tax=Sphingomonas psychrolutea TaxID=1259676 RepID=A0ABQ1H0Q1_9SPHN|nr:hypothetical protein [Sphingomonas psychrolutea]GGA54631.1 hypothetical protein GCM10011395_26310 [Sphingomonas psychrolutea]